MRRSHHRIELPPIVKCSNCGSMKVRHTICSECGFYRGKSILATAEEL